MSKAKQGPIRPLSNEIVAVVLPSLKSMDFHESTTFAKQGKWNGKAFVWEYLRDEGDGLVTFLVIAACGGKTEGLVVDARSFRLEGAVFDIDQVSAKLSSDTQYLKGIAHYPLSLLGEISGPNIELRLLRLFESIPGKLRLLLMPLEFVVTWGFRILTTIAKFGLFIFYVPFVGIKNVTSMASNVVSGDKQKRIAIRATRNLEALFQDGVPGFLRRSAVALK